jgi:hypothetical protein
MSYDATPRFLLALGDDAETIAAAPGTRIVDRLPTVVVVETDRASAKAFAMAGSFVHVFRSADEALRALALFRSAS